jgi:ectoine hydroxylase-related dioxygenase (phytanoyl-CoA dioxygenase family)
MQHATNFAKSPQSEYMVMDKSIEDFEREVTTVGYSVFPGIISSYQLAQLRTDIPRRQEICRHLQIKNSVDAGMEGAAHHVVGGDDSLHDFLCAMYLDAYVSAYFGGEYILNTYGAINNATYSKSTYKHGLQFHRDVRTFSGDFRMMLNMLVMVDDFTLENGATKVVPGTHHIQDRPSEDYLEQHAIRITGAAGTIVLFNSNLWHSAAPNNTLSPRMALTLAFTRPFFKQQMDYPRMLGESFPSNARMRQLLGYNARVPCSYDEWYQPPQSRMYKPGQG